MAVLVIRTRRRSLIAGVCVVATVVAAYAARPLVRLYVGTAAPPQYYRALTTPPDTGGRRVLGIGHNAGNNRATASAALAHRADVIEIDVVRVGNVLAAGRDRPWRWLADRVFQGQTLAEAWHRAAAARVIQLDLQQTDHRLLDALINFVRPLAGTRSIIVSTRNPSAVEYLAPRLPRRVIPMLSVPYPEAVSRLRDDSRLNGAIGGISVYHELLDDDLVRWAHEHRLVVFAWTVDDAVNLNRVLDEGVDGVSTENLAVLAALSTGPAGAAPPSDEPFGLPAP
jgi:Glycerophosphoryl diester phosphodiesterase family